MKDKKYLKKKLKFFEKESYYKKGERLAIDPRNFDQARRYEFDQIYSFLNIVEGKKIIELGAGYGKFVLPFLKLGYSVTAIDISNTLLSFIKKIAKKNKLEEKLKMQQTDFNKQMYKNVFDAGYCISTYHLVAETKKERMIIFSNFVKSIKPGGVVLLVEPNPLNPLLYLLYMFTPQASWDVEKHFLKSHEWHLKELFRKESLKKVTIKYVGFLPLRYLKYPLVGIVNRLINQIPLINKFSTFIYIRGIKSKE